MKKMLIRLLLGNNKRYFTLIKIKGKLYKVDIQPYESMEDMKKKAMNNGVFMA